MCEDPRAGVGVGEGGTVTRWNKRTDHSGAGQGSSPRSSVLVSSALNIIEYERRENEVARDSSSDDMTHSMVKTLTKLRKDYIIVIVCIFTISHKNTKSGNRFFIFLFFIFHFFKNG